jgi:hypothetical protein
VFLVSGPNQFFSYSISRFFVLVPTPIDKVPCSSKILVATSTTATGSAEVIDALNPEVSCQDFGDLHNAKIHGTFGGLILGKYPIICGGQTLFFMVLSQCFVVGSSNSKVSLSSPRFKGRRHCMLPGIRCDSKKITSKIRGRTYPLFEDIISYPYPGPKKEYYILPLSRQKKGYGYISYILCQILCQHCQSF